MDVGVSSLRTGGANFACVIPAAGVRSVRMQACAAVDGSFRRELEASFLNIYPNLCALMFSVTTAWVMVCRYTTSAI